MPAKKSKLSNRKARGIVDDKELQFKNPGEDYARVTKKLGNSRIMVHSLELNKEISCHIRGNIRGKNYRNIIKDGYVLISFRNMNGEYDHFLKNGTTEGITGDVIYNYTEKDVNDLRKAREIKDEMNTNDEFDDMLADLEDKKKKANPAMPIGSFFDKNDDSENDNVGWLEGNIVQYSSKDEQNALNDLIDFI